MKKKSNYTPEQDEFLRKGYLTMMLSELTKAFNTAFDDNKLETQIRSFLRNHKIRSGRTGRFEKGIIPWSASVRGKGVLKSNNGSFKKGTIPPNSKPLNSERMSKSGVLIKVEEPNPYNGQSTRYKQKQVYIWEQLHGSVPNGFVVAFADSNNLNFNPDNLILLKRSELLRLNRKKYRQIHDELKPSALALTKLEVKIFEKMREQRGDSNAR